MFLARRCVYCEIPDLAVLSELAIYHRYMYCILYLHHSGLTHGTCIVFCTFTSQASLMVHVLYFVPSPLRPHSQNMRRGWCFGDSEMSAVVTKSYGIISLTVRYFQFGGMRILFTSLQNVCLWSIIIPCAICLSISLSVCPILITNATSLPLQQM